MTDQPCPRTCLCGCGAGLCNAHPQALYSNRTCRRRAKRRRFDERSLPGGLTRVPMAMASDPAHTPQKMCEVCCNCSWRRDRVCAGCGKPYAAERVSTQ